MSFLMTNTRAVKLHAPYARLSVAILRHCGRKPKIPESDNTNREFRQKENYEHPISRS